METAQSFNTERHSNLMSPHAEKVSCIGVEQYGYTVMFKSYFDQFELTLNLNM